ncbi:Protein DEHYDRATION-INDUCED 19 homolog 3 [Zea mays]|uniref:Protein DEHYDRATION-INDUCED 19 homolog 3 n=1 Tax=Zea mays TaxID=4577 RepID=A0A1D6M282_MAIZE|nr:Protein DEHYDRATION-INDUCED 19 homolog 3 [Zea mays]
MDAADVWGRSSSSSSSSAAAARRLQARYGMYAQSIVFFPDLYMGIDDADAGLDEVTEPRGGAESYNCPFCGEDFDFVGLCCHIDDEHAVEAKSGVCCFLLFPVQFLPSDEVMMSTIGTSMPHLCYKGRNGLDRTFDYATWKLFQDILF